jgi:MFS family permease
LTVGTFNLVAGRLGDIFGHTLLFILGYAWFGLWSLIAGVAVYSHSLVFFAFCRAMQGIGPAVLMPCSLAILGRTYKPGRRKEMVFAIFGAVAPGGFVIGAVFSSLLAQLAWWPWTYWCMAITCSVLSVLAIWIIPAPADDDGGSSDAGNQPFDYLGAITGVSGLVLFNVAWNQAPNVGWQSPYVVVLLVLGLLFFAAFYIVERKVRQPLVPVSALKTETYFVLGCVALGWSSFGIFIYYIWQFLGNLRHETPLDITAQLVPASISGLCAAVTTGFLISRIRTSYIMVMAMTAFCVGNILIGTMPVGQIYWAQTFVGIVVICWGMDMSFPAATVILSNLVPKRHQGVAASLVTTVVNYSISIGLGIAGTVESKVNGRGTNLERGYRGAYYAAIGLSGCGIVLSLLFVALHYMKNK